MPRRMCPRVPFKTEYSENVLPNFSVPPIGEEFSSNRRQRQRDALWRPHAGLKALRFGPPRIA
jgi:hypothetical protein